MSEPKPTDPTDRAAADNFASHRAGYDPKRLETLRAMIHGNPHRTLLGGDGAVLLAALEAAEQDVARINWLERHRRRIVPVYDGRAQTWDAADLGDVPRPIGEATWRQAVDAVIRRDQEPKPRYFCYGNCGAEVGMRGEYCEVCG